MSDDTLFDQAVKIASGGGGFAAVLLFGRWFLDWLTGRYDKVQQRLDAERIYLDDRMREHTASLEKRCKAAEDEAAKCHEDKLALSERLAVLEGFDKGSGDLRNEVQKLRALERRLDAMEGRDS